MNRTGREHRPLSRRHILFMLLPAAALAGCILLLNVRVRPGDPPTFSVCDRWFTNGYSDRLTRLVVSGGAIVGGRLSGLTPLWEIRAIDKPQSIRGLHYGEVPDGFVQTLPTDGSAPPKLRPGWAYTVRVSGARGGEEMFDYQGRAIGTGKLKRVEEEYLRQFDGAAPK
jgi:hypothetical protein